MSLSDSVSSVASIIYADGAPMTGCLLSDDEAVAWTKNRYSNMSYCLVRDWRWLDIDVSDETRDGLKKRGLLPAVVFANNVVIDSRMRWGRGDWVKTSLLHRYDEGGVFMTLNTVYLLMAEGTRQTTTLEALRSIV